MIITQDKTNWKYILIVAVLAAIVGGISYWQYQEMQKEEFGGEINIPEKAVEDETADWKTYRNEEYGFEFQYPEDWTIKENAFGSAVSMFNLVVEPNDTAHLPRPIRINILPNDWIERVQKSFEEDGIELLDVQIDRVDGVRYNHTDEGLPQIDFLIPRGDYWVVIGGKKEYIDILNQVLDTFKFLK